MERVGQGKMRPTQRCCQVSHLGNTQKLPGHSPWQHTLSVPAWEG